MVLRPAAEQGRFLLRTITGSAYFASGLQLQTNAVVVEEPLLGKVPLTAGQLLDVRRFTGGSKTGP